MSGDGGTVFSQNMSEFVQVSHKVFFAAADRNKDVILEQLRPFLNKAQLVLEVASGSGQHIQHFAREYPQVVFQPSEYDTDLLPSILAYAAELEEHRIKTPLPLDAINQEHWQKILESGRDERPTFEGENSGPYDLVMTTNVFHISPWIVGQSIVRGAGRVLKTGGHLILYGPFKKNGTFNTESNKQFDETLRGKDPSWGVRDMEAIAEVAENEARLKHVQTIDMPSNNYLLIFEKVEA
ncbi:hypothetical protein BG006_002596 [Podila minutissima]|uniref:SAM-dependent methyltransferase n=1 Tax=Podila minutissima TaxID=64525 RepID=A0A9P5SS80_9FUNG|nr:hypothetical protein BG006_002596 [Podila minutissima]